MATADGASTNYGMGWASQMDGAGNQWFGHSGGSIGGITQLVAYPEPQVVVAMLTNSSRVDYADTHLRIAHLFMPESLEYRTLDEEALRAFLGDYLLNGDTPARVTLEDGRLYVSRRNGLPELLIPMADGSFHTLGNIWFRFRTHPEMVVEVPGREEVMIGVKR